MKAFALLTLAVAFAVGCSKPADTASTSGTSSGSSPASGTTTGGAPAGGKYAAVQTLFTTNCTKCHGGAHPKGGINLTSYDNVMKGGSEGPVVSAGDPSGSKIIKALHGKGARQMPPTGPLPATDVATVEVWIKDGAKNG